MVNSFDLVIAETSNEVKIVDEDIAYVDNLDVSWVGSWGCWILHGTRFGVDQFWEGHLDLVITILSHEWNGYGGGLPIFVLFISDSVQKLLFCQHHGGKINVGETSAFSD